jgi:hypothetical protein
VDLGRTFKGAGVRNLSQMSSTTSGEHIAYNKLLGHQDGIIADIVRREGLVRVCFMGVLWVGGAACQKPMCCV